MRHADDRKWRFVHGERLAERPLRAPEAPLRKPIADHRNRHHALAVVVRAYQPPGGLEWPVTWSGKLPIPPAGRFTLPFPQNSATAVHRSVYTLQNTSSKS